jgi:hypothetical protein
MGTVSGWHLRPRAALIEDAAPQASADLTAMASTRARRRRDWAALTCAANNVRELPVETLFEQHTIEKQSVVPDCAAEAKGDHYRRGGYHQDKRSYTSEEPCKTMSTAVYQPTGTQIPGLKLTVGLGIRVDVLEADSYYDNGVIRLMKE